MYIDIYRFQTRDCLTNHFFRLLFSGSINEVNFGFRGLLCVVGSRNLF